KRSADLWRLHDGEHLSPLYPIDLAEGYEPKERTGANGEDSRRRRSGPTDDQECAPGQGGNRDPPNAGSHRFLYRRPVSAGGPAPWRGGIGGEGWDHRRGPQGLP